MNNLQSLLLVLLEINLNCLYDDVLSKVNAVYVIGINYP